jgi:8-oxo-dGTP pyrophosphatase MutT (NUDIX family)
MSEEVEPRLAATVIVLRDGAAGPEIFMVVRHHEIDFASGALVFPGGRLEPGDLELAQDARCCSGPAVEPGALALRVAAVRETYEECGILLARPRGTSDLITAEQLPAFDPKRPFAALIREEQLVLATDLLLPFAHWITPPFVNKRFDTHFFLARAPGDQTGLHDGREAVDSLWISPRQALDDAEAGRFTLVFATARNLWKLSRFETVAAALDAARVSPIVTVMPELVTLEAGRGLKIPAAADYGGEVFAVPRPATR